MRFKSCTMRFENDGVTVWVVSIDRSEVTVAVKPIDAGNRAEILLQRPGQPAVERVPAQWLWNDHPDDIQYFRAGLSDLSPGDRYTAVCSCAGRQAPERTEDQHAWATFEPGSIRGLLPAEEAQPLRHRIETEHHTLGLPWIGDITSWRRYDGQRRFRALQHQRQFDKEIKSCQ